MPGPVYPLFIPCLHARSVIFSVFPSYKHGAAFRRGAQLAVFRSLPSPTIPPAAVKAAPPPSRIGHSVSTVHWNPGSVESWHPRIPDVVVVQKPRRLARAVRRPRHRQILVLTLSHFSLPRSLFSSSPSCLRVGPSPLSPPSAHSFADPLASFVSDFCCFVRVVVSTRSPFSPLTPLARSRRPDSSLRCRFPRSTSPRTLLSSSNI